MMYLITMLQKGAITSLLALSMVVAPSGNPEALIPENREEKASISLQDDKGDLFEGYSILREICSCESNLEHLNEDGKVLRGRVNTFDIGICQINELYHKDKIAKLGSDIYTEKGNIEYAKHLYDKEGVQPWIASKPCWQKRLLSLGS